MLIKIKRNDKIINIPPIEVNNIPTHKGIKYWNIYFLTIIYIPTPIRINPRMKNINLNNISFNLVNNKITMPKPAAKPLTLTEEVAAFSQTLLKISRGVENFYEKTNEDGTISLVFQTPAEALVVNLHRLFPELPTGLATKAPNLCNENCKADLQRFFDQGVVTTPRRCSLDNPPRSRVRDGCLEHSCLWARVYDDMARAPSGFETYLHHARELMDSSLKIPVLSLPVGPDVYIPTLDSKYAYTRPDQTSVDVPEAVQTPVCN